MFQLYSIGVVCTMSEQSHLMRSSGNAGQKNADFHKIRKNRAKMTISGPSAVTTVLQAGKTTPAVMSHLY